MVFEDSLMSEQIRKSFKDFETAFQLNVLEDFCKSPR